MGLFLFPTQRKNPKTPSAARKSCAALLLSCLGERIALSRVPKKGRFPPELPRWSMDTSAQGDLELGKALGPEPPLYRLNGWPPIRTHPFNPAVTVCGPQGLGPHPADRPSCRLNEDPPGTCTQQERRVWGGEGWLRPWQLIGYQRYVCDPRVCSTEQLLPSALRRCKLVVEQRVAAYRPLKGIPSKYY